MINTSAVNPVIRYVQPEQMAVLTGEAYFGYCTFPPAGLAPRVYIRCDLPRIVQKSLLGHECQHAKDGDRGGFWRNEPRCWVAGFKAQPIGFVLGLLYGVTRLPAFLRHAFGART